MKSKNVFETIDRLNKIAGSKKFKRKFKRKYLLLKLYAPIVVWWKTRK